MNTIKQSYVVHSWMIKDLGLKGLDLLLYAIIFDSTKDGEKEFSGTLSYLEEMTGCTKRGIIKSLNQLVDNGLIIRTQVQVHNVRFSHYKIDCSKISSEGDRS